MRPNWAAEREYSELFGMPLWRLAPKPRWLRLGVGIPV
jgi:hypothetical protein